MSFIAPLQNSELQVSRTIDEMKNIVGENGSKQFENCSADILDESTKADLQENKSDRGNQLRNQEEQKAMGELYDNTPFPKYKYHFNIQFILNYNPFPLGFPLCLMYLCIFS